MDDPFELKVPQMGEGMRYATVVRYLKNLGEWVEEDTDIVEVETEKATIGIVAPVSGYLVNRLCVEGEQVAVGTPLAEISKKLPSVEKMKSAPLFANQVRKKDLVQSPHTKTITPADREQMPRKQQELIRHMMSSKEIICPASLTSKLDWQALENIRRSIRKHSLGNTTVPSSLEIVCWAVSMAMQTYPKFRSKLDLENNITLFDSHILGIAVSNDDDTIDVPSVELTSKDSLSDVSQKVRKRIKSRKLGSQSEPPGYHSISISDMSTLQIFQAQPVVVHPAVATIVICSPQISFKGDTNAREANLVLAFDHRLVNGFYAAKFLKKINQSIQTLSKQINAENMNETLDADRLKKYGT